LPTTLVEDSERVNTETEQTWKSREEWRLCRGNINDADDFVPGGSQQRTLHE